MKFDELAGIHGLQKTFSCLNISAITPFLDVWTESSFIYIPQIF